MSARDANNTRSLALYVADTLELAEGESVFGVGCGAGSLLLPFQEAGCAVGGIDPSASLIAEARGVMPDGRWVVGEAAALDPAEPFTVVVACGSFQGFPDHAYARGVLARMAAKATRAVAILDVLDAGDVTGARLDLDRRWFLRMLNEVGASAIQIGHAPDDTDPLAEHRYHVFAKL